MGKLGLLLFQDVRRQKKTNDISVTTPVAYITGFLPLDYINGQRIKVFDDDDNILEEYDSVGLVDGAMCSFIADPGLGKTTMAQQIAVEIASKFEQSFIVHEDIERSSNIGRVFNITGQKPKWIRNHYVIHQDGHGEDIVDRFLDHAKIKLNNRKDFEYDTGLKDMYGTPIKMLVPSIVIIDSLAVMRSEDNALKEDTKESESIDGLTGNNMMGARNAKFNSELFKQILPWAKKANILLFVINQINKKISTGFIAPARDLVGLGETESISGGRAYLYLSNNILRFKNKGMLKQDKDYKINGNIISAVYYKSRTNASNVDVELIFDKQNGFSKCLTLLNYAINENIVKKQGSKLVVPGCEDTPFTKGTFIQEAVQNPMLIVKLYDLCLPHLQEYLSGSPFDGGYASSSLEDEDRDDIDSFLFDDD